MGVIEKRTQAERLAIIESLLVGINSEIYEGKAEPILQQAVNCQIEINRMVFELNRLREKGEMMSKGDITALFIMLGCIVGLLIKITLEIQG